MSRCSALALFNCDVFISLIFHCFSISEKRIVSKAKKKIELGKNIQSCNLLSMRSLLEVSLWINVDHYILSRCHNRYLFSAICNVYNCSVLLRISFVDFTTISMYFYRKCAPRDSKHIKDMCIIKGLSMASNRHDNFLNQLNLKARQRSGPRRLQGTFLCINNV